RIRRAAFPRSHRGGQLYSFSVHPNRQTACLGGSCKLRVAGALAVIELSRHVFEALRKDEEFILYRGRSKGGGSRVLVLSPVVEHPRPESLKRLEHEYSLRDELDPKWAARPIAIARLRGRTVLVLEDPRGVPLDQLLGHPMDLASSLRLAIGLSAAI